jgi:hypothetical protein
MQGKPISHSTAVHRSANRALRPNQAARLLWLCLTGAAFGVSAWLMCQAVVRNSNLLLVVGTFGLGASIGGMVVHSVSKRLSCLGVVGGGLLPFVVFYLVLLLAPWLIFTDD